MRLIKTAGACAVIAAAVGALLASASYADVKGLFAKEVAVLTSQGISSARAMQALDVQGKVARADLPSKLQAATGSAFAGVWFEPAAAQLHIGATSPASRRTAEGVAAQAGLSANVTVTTVRSTMAELLATQRQWNRKLAGLFAREEVKTGLEPQRNAVSVTLTSSVPPSERAALEREAAAASVNVFVTVVAGARLGLAPQAKTECKKWEKFEAYCNPSITSGVAIAGTIKCKKVANQEGPQFFLTEKACKERGKVGEKGEWERQIPGCSAGPLAINSKKERVLLTAGHCISEAKELWWATNKAEKESVIGPVENFVFGGAAGEKKGDYGDILIEAAWQTGKPANPVFAVTAEWAKMNEKGEETSYPVKGERVPVVKNTNCHEGQTSGEWCGEIKMLNVTVPYEAGHIVEGLVEDAGENLNGEGGDSGGPWLFIEASQEALMEGLHSGIVPECVNQEKPGKGPEFFESQKECFEGKGVEKGKWQLKSYKCKEVAKVGIGAKFYATLEDCENRENAGEGQFERTPEIHLVYQPLKQPVGGAAEGPLEAYKLELLTTANEAIGPVILPTLTAEEKWTGESGKDTLEVLKNAFSVVCQKDKSEGTIETSKPLGLFHIDFEGCKAAVVACTGLGEAKEVILLLGTYHLVFDTLGAKLSEAGVGILFLFEPAHFECTGKLVGVEGQLLCLIKNPNEKAKHFEIVCKKGKETGDPGETVYWNEEGKEVKMGEELFLLKENEKAGVMSSLNTTALILTTKEIEIMT